MIDRDIPNNPEKLLQEQMDDSGLKVISLLAEHYNEPTIVPPHLVEQYGYDSKTVIEIKDDTGLSNEDTDEFGGVHFMPHVVIKITTLRQPLEDYEDPAEAIRAARYPLPQENPYISITREVHIPSFLNLEDHDIQVRWFDMNRDPSPEGSTPIGRFVDMLDTASMQKELGMHKLPFEERERLCNLLNDLVAFWYERLDINQAEAIYGPRATQRALYGLRTNVSKLLVPRRPWLPGGFNEEDGPHRTMTLDYRTMQTIAPDAMQQLGVIGPMHIREDYEHFTNPFQDPRYRRRLQQGRKIIIDFPRLYGDSEQPTNICAVEDLSGLTLARVNMQLPADPTEPLEAYKTGRHFTQLECQALTTIIEAAANLPLTSRQKMVLGATALAHRLRNRKYRD